MADGILIVKAVFGPDPVGGGLEVTITSSTLKEPIKGPTDAQGFLNAGRVPPGIYNVDVNGMGIFLDTGATGVKVAEREVTAINIPMDRDVL